MKRIVPILLLFFLFVSPSLQQEYPLNKKKVPSSKGIELYIKTNQLKIIKEFQQFVKDTIYNDLYISCENLSQFSDYDSMELGRFYVPNEIIITNEEKFIAYELNNLTGFKRKNYQYSNKFVKSTLIHEIGHAYFIQVILMMREYNLEINSAYNNFRMIPTLESSYSSNFIEEGVCEYISQKMNESIPPKEPYIPQNIDEVRHPYDTYLLKYEYSAYYLKTFLDFFGVREGIQILVRNKPPTYEEILTPNIFFNRIL